MTALNYMISLRGVSRVLAWRTSSLNRLLLSFQRRRKVTPSGMVVYPKGYSATIRRCMELNRQVTMLTQIKKDMELILNNTTI
jgi:hypothetical protein